MCRVALDLELVMVSLLNMKCVQQPLTLACFLSTELFERSSALQFTIGRSWGSCRVLMAFFFFYKKRLVFVGQKAYKL